MVIEIIAIAFGLVGTGLSIWRWRQMRGWKQAFYYGEMVIAYNNRIMSRIKLAELYQWCWALSEDKRWKGETFFKRNKVSLSITRPLTPPSKAEEIWRKMKKVKVPRVDLIKRGKVVDGERS